MRTLDLSQRPTDVETTPNGQTQSASTTDTAALGMNAVVRDTYGEPEDVLRLGRIPRPQVGADDVLIHVQAAGVDQGVWHVSTGLPYPIRLAGYGLRAPTTRVPGGDLAGTVAAVGAGVTAFKVGDEVYGFGRGTFAEYALARPDKLARKPANLTFQQAAAVPVSGLTALQALRKGHLRAGQRVLILGASGGVGTFAVQIAKTLGAEVTGVASTGKLDLVRSLGADHVLDYTRDDLAEQDRAYDLVLDIGGNRPLRLLRRLLTRTGRLVITGGEGGGRWLGGTDRQLRAMTLSPFVPQHLGTFVAKQNSADLAALTELIEAGRVTPALARTYRLADAATAVRDLRAGRIRGKAVIDLTVEQP
jgi:NADPH:quinone reductase-like Zn-dependent oxidoreductase